MTGKTTLSTTCLICSEASDQVPSMAPATSPVPAARAGAEQAGQQENSQEKAKEFLALFHINRLSFCEKKEPQRSSPRLDFYAGGKKEIPRPVFSVIYLGLLRFQRGNVPVIPETAPDRE